MQQKLWVGIYWHILVISYSSHCSIWNEASIFTDGKVGDVNSVDISMVAGSSDNYHIKKYYEIIIKYYI